MFIIIKKHLFSVRWLSVPDCITAHFTVISTQLYSVLILTVQLRKQGQAVPGATGFRGFVQVPNGDITHQGKDQGFEPTTFQLRA